MADDGAGLTDGVEQACVFEAMIIPRREFIKTVAAATALPRGSEQSPRIPEGSSSEPHRQNRGPQPAGQPSFLFITTDQQRWDTLGCSGNPHIRTPNLDRIAAEGMRFTRMYSSNPICMPSRASLLTGRSQRGHQVCEHGVNLSEAIPVIGDSLIDAGYRTALFGKAHFRNSESNLYATGYGSNRPSSDRPWYGPYYGFQHVELTKGTAPQGHWKEWLQRHHPEAMGLWDMEQATEPPTGAFQCWKNAMPKELYHTHWIVDRAIEWLRSLPPGQPFFCWISFPDPHHPFCPPAPYHSMYNPDELPDPIAPQRNLVGKPEHHRWVVGEEHIFRGTLKVGQAGRGRFAREMKAMYYGMISMIDDEVGRLNDALQSRVIGTNTHVIFTSDHGEALMDHGVFGKPPLTYESIVRVPFLWRKPGTVAAGTRFDGVVSNTDFAPTVLDLAGAKPLNGMDGRSFAPVLTGRTGKHRDAVVVERIAVTQNVEPIVRYKMVVTKDWKLVAHGGRSPWELYHLPTDPFEERNLWEDERHAGERRRMTEVLLSEIVDSELGDVAALWRAQGKEPFGALRDPARIARVEAP